MTTLITAAAVRAAAPSHPQPAAAAASLSRAAERYGISGRASVAMLLAQLAHESGLLPITENLNYRAERIAQVWPTRFPSATSAAPYAGNPEALGNKAYGNRMGNVFPGDGYLYRGRGYIQITGRDMYASVGRAIGLDLVGQPDLLLTHDVSALAACEFLKRKNLIARLGSGDVRGVTLVINGGYNGLPDRQARYARVLAALAEVQVAKPAAESAVILIDAGGREIRWDGQSAVYGGVELSEALISQLRTVYPTPGTYEYVNLRVYVRRNGDIVLERK